MILTSRVGFHANGVRDKIIIIQLMLKSHSISIITLICFPLGIFSIRSFDAVELQQKCFNECSSHDFAQSIAVDRERDMHFDLLRNIEHPISKIEVSLE